MLRVKTFEDKKVVFEDENKKEYVLTCDGDDQNFDLDIIEDILDYVDRKKVS